MTEETKNKLQAFKDFSPTGFDSKENYISHTSEEESLAHWLVGPGRNRDSDILGESNFHSAVEMLGGESDNVQIHRFGHWACGWYEIILVKPDTEQTETLLQIMVGLEDYPVLDEDDFSEREHEQSFETLTNDIPSDLVPDPPDDFVFKVLEKLSELNCYPSDCCYSEEDILQAVNALGYKTEEQIETEQIEESNNRLDEISVSGYVSPENRALILNNPESWTGLSQWQLFRIDFALPIFQTIE